MKKISMLLLFTIICIISCSKSENGFTVNRKGTITAYKGQETSFDIPAQIANTPVTAIGDKAFVSKNLQIITLPDGVISIGKKAFYDNQRMESIIIPESVSSIGEAAFGRLSNARLQLTSITISNNVTLATGYAPSFDNGFVDFYYNNHRKAGNYRYIDDSWVIISDVYYYRLGVNEYKNGNYEGAIYWLNILKEMYPKSTYIESADKIIINSQPKPKKGERDELEYSKWQDANRKLQNENLSEDEFMALFYELLEG